MTISIANVETTTDSFSQWVTKTNQIADALSNKIVTTDSNTAVGNAAVSASFSANTLYANTLSGGNTSAAANLTISTNTFFQQNIYFTGARFSMGSAANLQINSGNSTSRVLTVNSAAGNTLSVSKITFSDLSDSYITTPGNGQFMVYSSANSYWYNTNAIYFNANTSDVTFANTIQVGNSSVNLTINSTMVAVNGNSALLKVYYANNIQAFP